MRSTADENRASAQEVSNLECLDSTMFSISLTDLARRIDEALRLAPGAEERVGWGPVSANPKTLVTFQHFIKSDIAVASDAYRDVMKGDMIQVAFKVCVLDVPPLLRSVRLFQRKMAYLILTLYTLPLRVRT